VKRDNIDTQNTHIQDHPLSWIGIDISIKCGGVKLVLCGKRRGEVLK
jgi:hypothetical protein